ncbi:MAG: class I SAM-dependent methyltransferase [Proteobacteria bacterium]|nr:class I SAM-dependent methyltransferase [Pseudomonadota bacterium]
MRISYRAHGGAQDYWQRRWDDVAVDSGSINLDRYPGRFAEHALKLARPAGPVLEAGCGAGRVLRHYHERGVEIIGLDFIASVLAAIHREDARIPLAAGDITNLPFPNETFSAVLAFGLYHGLEAGLDEAMADTRRVIKTGGVLCASMRLDNLQNRMTDRLAGTSASSERLRFHKLNLTTAEFKALATRAGFEVETVQYVENMSFLYKFPALRHASQRVFRENEARGKGYRFNLTGNILQRGAMAIAPAQMANLAVITARAI